MCKREANLQNQKAAREQSKNLDNKKQNYGIEKDNNDDNNSGITRNGVRMNTIVT